MKRALLVVIPFVVSLLIAISLTANTPCFAAYAREELNESECAGRLIWFKAMAGNDRLHTSVFQQRVGSTAYCAATSAPYLHNGSVPTLRDLLQPPAQRPAVFWCGYDAYDPIRASFETQSQEAKRIGIRHKVSAKRSDNQGHTFGTGLPAQGQDALVEHLKTS